MYVRICYTTVHISSIGVSGLSVKKEKIDRRTHILDAAEELFSYHGYVGTSIRDIANQADVQLASVGYYFGPKEDLLEAVMERRASYFSEERLSNLATEREKAGDRPIPVDALVHAYMWPFVERVINGGEGWQNYAKMMALLANSSRWQSLVNKYFDEASMAFIEELKRSLPHCSDLAILSGFQIMAATMLIVCAETGRYESLSKGSQSSGQFKNIYEELVPFLVAGFKAVNR